MITNSLEKPEEKNCIESDGIKLFIKNNAIYATFPNGKTHVIAEA